MTMLQKLDSTEISQIIGIGNNKWRERKIINIDEYIIQVYNRDDRSLLFFSVFLIV